MVRHERGLEGSIGAGKASHKVASAGPNPARPSAEMNRYWVTHRQGPFLFHEVSGSCEPLASDNVGFHNDITAIINQGFAPCPKCIESK